MEYNIKLIIVLIICGLLSAAVVSLPLFFIH